MGKLMPLSFPDLRENDKKCECDANEWQCYTVMESLSVSGVMQRINANKGGVLFLTDEKNRILGSITDGDIRRFLLAGGKLNENAMTAANNKPKCAYSKAEAEVLYHSKHYVAIPIINTDRVILDIYVGDKIFERRDVELNIPVVINAGGKGTRLDPFTRVLPKPLIPVGQLPIMEHIMKEFQSYSCEEFHVIVNYKRQLLKTYFAECENKYNIAWYDEDEPLGTGGGLGLLRGKLQNTFFFTNCDNLLRVNYEKILQFHRENRNVITMICAYKNFPIPYGVVEMGINGEIEEIREKPLLSFWTNTGIYIVEPTVLEDIEEGVAIGFPDIIEKQRQKGGKIAAYPVNDNEWMDMGQLSELDKMCEKLYGE